MVEETPIVLRLSKEEEKKLAKIDEKIYGCPYFYHNEYYHVSHILKNIFLGEVGTEGLTEEEKDLVEKIERRTDVWWDIYVPVSEVEYDIEFKNHDWSEIEIVVYTTDGERSSNTIAEFKRVKDGWTLITDKEKDLREFILEFLGGQK